MAVAASGWLMPARRGAGRRTARWRRPAYGGRSEAELRELRAKARKLADAAAAAEQDAARRGDGPAQRKHAKQREEAAALLAELNAEALDALETGSALRAPPPPPPLQDEPLAAPPPPMSRDAFLQALSKQVARLASLQRLDGVDVLDVVNTARDVAAAQEAAARAAADAFAAEAVARRALPPVDESLRDGDALRMVELLQLSRDGGNAALAHRAELLGGRDTAVRVGEPAHFVLRERGGGVSVGVRGVRDQDDYNAILSAANAAPSPLLGGYWHSGALEAARWLVDSLGPEVRAAPSVTLFGHSLGGAVAGAAALILHADGARDVRVTTFGAPPCASDLAPALREVRAASYVFGDDCVCRLSDEAVCRLLDQSQQRARVGRDRFRAIQRLEASVALDDGRGLVLPGRTVWLRRLGGVVVPEEVLDRGALGGLCLAERGLADHALASYRLALEEAGW